jgi:hypothetical protein
MDNKCVYRSNSDSILFSQVNIKLLLSLVLFGFSLAVTSGLTQHSSNNSVIGGKSGSTMTYLFVPHIMALPLIKQFAPVDNLK